MPEREYYCTTCSGTLDYTTELTIVVVVCSGCNQVMELRDKEE